MEQQVVLDVGIDWDDELAKCCSSFPITFPSASSGADSAGDNAGAAETARGQSDQEETLEDDGSSDSNPSSFHHLGLLDNLPSTGQGVHSPYMGVHLTEDQLVSLSLRDLNKLVRDLPASEVRKIRKKRRILKNRYYASTLRQKRRLQEIDIKREKEKTTTELEDAKAELEIVRKERDTYKMKYEQLEYLWRKCGPPAVRWTHSVTNCETGFDPVKFWNITGSNMTRALSNQTSHSSGIRVIQVSQPELQDSVLI